MPKLDRAQTKSALAAVLGWKAMKGPAIQRTFQFKDFAAAIKFVNGIAKLAEKAWHHPDIDVRWNQVTLTLTTHSEGGLTAKDFKLAKQFDQCGRVFRVASDNQNESNCPCHLARRTSK